MIREHKQPIRETENGFLMYASDFKRHGVFETRDAAEAAYWLNDYEIDVIQEKANLTDKKLITKDMVDDFNRSKQANGFQK